MSHVLRSAFALVGLTAALAGCGETASSQPSSAPPTTAASQAQATVANAAPSAGPCDDTQFVVDLVTGLQQGKFPDDSRSAAHRFGALINNAPPEIKEATDHLVGPVIETLQHPDVQGEVTTDAVSANVKTIEQWHAAHC